MILVTGGSGFIGSATVWELNSRGIENIIISDHLGVSAKWKNLRALKFDDYYEKDDILEHIIFDTLPHKLECVIHMGACSSTSENDCSYLAYNNYEYTKVLADYCMRKDIKFIYASSAATYGDGSSGFSDDENLLETLRPLNMYGYSKQMFDLYAKRKGYFDKITGIKFFNVYGPNEHHKGDMSSKIYKAYHEILQTGRISLFKSGNSSYGDGDFVRDFVYVKDCARIVCDLSVSKSISGIFNLGSGKARSWNDLAKAVFAGMDVPVNIEYFNMPDNIKDQYQYFTQSDNSKLMSIDLNIDFCTLESGIEDYIKNYMAKGKLLGD